MSAWNTAVFVLFGFLFGFLFMPLAYETFYVPAEQTVFYAYQNLIAGFLALAGGGIAYLGVLKNLKWHEEKAEACKAKVMEDLKADSSAVLFQLLIFYHMVVNDLTDIVFDVVEFPLELGYKFEDNESIEKLDSVRRLNVRGMVSRLGEFNREIESKNYAKAKEAMEFFLLSYEKVFDTGYKDVDSLCSKMAEHIKNNRNS